MFTPDVAPSCLAHMPAQFTTYSHLMSPWSVVTPVTRPPLWVTPVTGVFWMMRTPCWRAPRARAMVQSTGFTRPSFLR